MAYIWRVSTCVVLVVLLLKVSTGAKKDEEDKSCDEKGYVCRSLMKYEDDLVNDEESLCVCGDGECENKWKDNDTKSITWTHHERADQKVQYKFCTDVNKKETPLCAKNQEHALIMATDVTYWNIRVHKFNCRCPSGNYDLLGWARFDNVWFYYYGCHLPTCPEKGKVCLKIYLDRSVVRIDQVKRYEFQCKCQKSQKCPSEMEDPDKLSELESDVGGTFFTKNCTVNFPPKKKKQN